jgi:hypothetical protein
MNVTMATKIETHRDWTNGEALKYLAIHPVTTPKNTQAIANIVLLNLPPYGVQKIDLIITGVHASKQKNII